jgi:hypothetical protein
MSAALRQKNENFILWEPVVATDKPFTSMDCIVPLHQLSIADFDMALFDKAAVNRFAVPIIAYDDMVKMAKKSPPDASWFDEDFTNLRHPER